MNRTKVGPKHQITIPKEVFNRLGLNVGDMVEVSEFRGQAVIKPLEFALRTPAPKLTKEEQNTLIRAQQKIKAIRNDMVSAVGLTRKEASVAAKAGLIDEEQIYWWLESWQKMEREADGDIKQDNTLEEFADFNTLKDRLKK